MSCADIFSAGTNSSLHTGRGGEGKAGAFVNTWHMASSTAGGKLGFTFHILGAALFTFTFYQDLKLDSPTRATYGGRRKFFTVLNVASLINL